MVEKVVLHSYNRQLLVDPFHSGIINYKSDIYADIQCVD